MPLNGFMKFVAACVAVLCLLLGAGCAGRQAASADVFRGDGLTAPADSLRAKFKLTIVQEGDEQNLDAVLFSVPGRRYRMELTGPMGIGVASLLWTDSGWTMTFPTEKLYVKGVGYMVGLLNDKSLPLVHIHQVAGLFEGKLLPEKFDALDSADGLARGVDGLGRVFSYEAVDGRIGRLSYAGRDGKLETLRFLNFKEFEGRFLPETIIFERNEKRFLEIRIKKVNHGKPFSGGTWKLNVPRSFKPVDQ